MIKEILTIILTKICKKKVERTESVLLAGGQREGKERHASAVMELDAEFNYDIHYRNIKKK
jgi:hypothetical protein